MSDAFNIEKNSGASAIQGVTQFVRQIEGAAAFLTAAHADDEVVIPALTLRAGRRAHSRHGGWYTFVVSASATRLQHVLMVFTKHPAQGPGSMAEFEAFKMLSELTPAGPQLVALAKRDRRLAFRELAKHMDLVRRQFEATAALVDHLPAGAGDAEESDAVTDAGDARFAAVRDALLVQAGGTFSLTEAAKHLGVTRQALHKRIVSGSALGMMRETEIVVPRLQFVDADSRATIMPGIDQVTKLFKEAQAGAWSALQFLVEPDPNLRRAPIEALKDGAVAEAVRAASTYLGLEEE
jgi:hypothetical protein